MVSIGASIEANFLSVIMLKYMHEGYSLLYWGEYWGEYWGILIWGQKTKGFLLQCLVSYRLMHKVDDSLSLWHAGARWSFKLGDQSDPAFFPFKCIQLVLVRQAPLIPTINLGDIAPMAPLFHQDSTRQCSFVGTSRHGSLFNHRLGKI